ncbi:MAG: cell division topological specificity factor MinE [Synechococcus sp.]
MNLIDFLEQLLSRNSKTTSSERARDRLKFVLAYDRAQLSPAMLESMCEEIMDVLSKYVELDREGFEFDLSSEDGATALIANFPIRRVHTPVPAPVE